VTSDEKHPIAAGFVALIAVGLAVGLMVGIFTVVFTHVAGLGGDDGSDAADGGPSLYLPTPQPTDTATGSAAAVPPATAPPPTSSAASAQITLQSGSTSVGPMERIDLSGVYPQGEGAVLQVQRKGSGGGWEDFPVTAAVTGGTFSTYVQTGRAGVQKFRVRDSDSGRVSNVVSVTVG
jgi:hypothetical protein